MLLPVCAEVKATATSFQSETPPLDFTALPELPDERGFGGPIVGVSENALIVAGGANFPVPLAEGGEKVWHDRIFVLLPHAGSWLDAGRLERPRAYAACASFEGGVFVGGGSDADGVLRDAFVMRWDPATRSVTTSFLPPLPEPSAFGAAEVVDGRVFVLQGKRSKSETDASGSAWRLDPGSDDPAWEPVASLPGGPRLKVVTAVQSGPEGERCMFAFSGSVTTSGPGGDVHYEFPTDAHRYSPRDDEWTRLADLPRLPDPRYPDGDALFATERWPIAAATGFAFGATSILTFSGSAGRHIRDATGRVTSPDTRPAFARRVLLYDTAEDAWSEAGRLPVGVVTTRAALWNGAIVISSGETKPGIRTPEVQSLPVPHEGPRPSGQRARLATLDYVVLAIYLLGMIAVGLHFARRKTTTDDFFLAGRKIPWWAAGISIFGTQLSAITFMAIPATAYGSDWRRFVGQLMMLPVFLLVIGCFVPLLRGLGVTTAYEYLESRFSRGVRLCASALFILFQLGRMGIVLLLPAIALSAATGIDVYACIAAMGTLATLYTALGGIAAVIWTDVLQVVVLVGGAGLCLAMAISDSGGLAAGFELARAANKLQMFDWRWSTSDMVGWVLIVGFLFTNLVPYTTDQTVIQRYLTTRDTREAAKSLWLNFAITIPTGILFFGLGTALWVYYTAHPIEQSALPQKSDQLVPWFVVSHLPSGVAGVVIAGIFAAAMSSLDSSMNSITTAVVKDFIEPAAEDRPDRDRMGLARALTVLLGVVGTASAMILATIEIRYLFDAFQRIIGLFGGGVAGVFLMAVFSSRANASGALAGLVFGGALTLAVASWTDVNFLLYAGIGTVSCIAIGLLVSAASGGNSKDIDGLTVASVRRRGHGNG